jgi:DNA-binding NarL/FixJ family response regulator
MTIAITLLSPIPLVREGLRALLAAEPDFRITPLAPDNDWFDEILADKPDVLLLDVHTLEREGWQVLNALRRALPALALVILGDSARDQRVAQAIALGARGYLLRDASAEEMAHALRAAHHGALVIQQALAASLVESLQHARASEQRERMENENDLVEPLTARELEVLSYMTRGLANKQIAAALFITEHTVKFHIRAILGKLGAANRTEAVTLALSKGLVNL